MTKSVMVLGAGIVGMSCALALQRRGWEVTLLDRGAPGAETSHGNAGVLARSSLIPFNHPGLWPSLPRLLSNRTPQFRYDPRFLARNLPWAAGFLLRARRACFEQTTAALDALIRLSYTEHLQLLKEARIERRLRANGWLFLYRSASAFAASRLARETFDRFGIATQPLDAQGLAALEPALRPIFPRALWIQDGASVDSPAGVVQAYASLFASRGGRIEQTEAVDLARQPGVNGWQVQGSDGRMRQAAHVVLALGPWSKDFLRRTQGLRVAMAFERGYHMHYGEGGGPGLRRPVYDTGGGYVLSPMEQGLRLTTGVELAAQDAPAQSAQMESAEAAARQAVSIGRRLDAQAWLGSRPTLPDSRPAIGPCPGRDGLWLAFGHQHIGFSTGPGTGALLGALMSGDPAPIAAAPYLPSRFVH